MKRNETALFKTSAGTLGQEITKAMGISNQATDLYFYIELVKISKEIETSSENYVINLTVNTHEMNNLTYVPG
jgi:hypothetical protein